MKKGDRFYSAVLAAVSDEGKVTKANLTLFHCADECDHLARRLVEDSRNMAERFSQFATYIEMGRTNDTPPTGYSTVRDIERNSVRLEMSVRQLRTMAEHLMSPDQFTAFQAALKGPLA